MNDRYSENSASMVTSRQGRQPSKFHFYVPFCSSHNSFHPCICRSVFIHFSLPSLLVRMTFSSFTNSAVQSSGCGRRMALGKSATDNIVQSAVTLHECKFEKSGGVFLSHTCVQKSNGIQPIRSCFFLFPHTQSHPFTLSAPSSHTLHLSHSHTQKHSSSQCSRTLPGVSSRNDCVHSSTLFLTPLVSFLTPPFPTLQ